MKLVSGVHKETQTEREFHALARQWRTETKHLSSSQAMIQHPAYQKIVGLGLAALPVLLRELQQRPDHWFWALRAISGEDAARPGATFRQAVEDWVRWGLRQHAAAGELRRG